MDFTKENKIIIRCLKGLRGISANQIESAVSHLEAASRIKDIDPSMAILRAISAEEEAASALFNVLKQKKYYRSKQLNCRNHSHKQSVIPFITSMDKYLFQSDDRRFHINLHAVEVKNSLMLTLRLFISSEAYIQPDPPLDIVSVGEEIFGEWLKDLRKKAENGYCISVFDYLKKNSEYRNTLLYADDVSLPEFDGDIEFQINQRKLNTFKIFSIICLTFPHKKKSRIVEQSIYCFLEIMNKKI